MAIRANAVFSLFIHSSRSSLSNLQKLYITFFFSSSAITSVYVFYVWPKIIILFLMWPREDKRLDNPDLDTEMFLGNV